MLPADSCGGFVNKLLGGGLVNLVECSGMGGSWCELCGGGGGGVIARSLLIVGREVVKKLDAML